MFRLKLMSENSGVRPLLAALSEVVSSTTIPLNQSCFPGLADMAAITSLVSLDVERSSGEVSFEGERLLCRVSWDGGRRWYSSRGKNPVGLACSDSRSLSAPWLA